MDLKAVATNEWSILRTSHTIKALVTMEAGAVGLFVDGVLAGTQQLTFGALKGWLAFQSAVVIAFFLRHAFAGLEAKFHNTFGGWVDQSTIEQVEQHARDDAVKVLHVLGHPEAAETLAAAFKADAKQGA